MKEGKAELRVTGIVFNLINHRPEICSLLLIKDEDWFEQQIDPLKYEKRGLKPFSFALKENQEELHSQYIKTFPLKDPCWAEIAKPWLMVPPGSAALILGVKEAVSILKIEDPRWVKGYKIKRHHSSTPESML